MKRYQVIVKQSGMTIQIFGNVKAKDALSAIDQCCFLLPKTNYPNAREYVAVEVK